MMFGKKKEEPTEEPVEESSEGQPPEDSQPKLEQKPLSPEKRAQESLNVEGYWDTRLARLQQEIDGGLWKARALGGDEEIENDISWIELVSKAESTFIELKCALSDTNDAPKVIVKASSQLRVLRTMVGTKLYPTAVLGMLQSCLYEQDIGFHSTVKGTWNFTEEMVNELYRLALQGVTVVEEAVETE